MILWLRKGDDGVQFMQKMRSFEAISWVEKKNCDEWHFLVAMKISLSRAICENWTFCHLLLHQPKILKINNNNIRLTECRMRHEFIHRWVHIHHHHNRTKQRSWDQPVQCNIHRIHNGIQHLQAVSLPEQIIGPLIRQHIRWITFSYYIYMTD